MNSSVASGAGSVPRTALAFWSVFATVAGVLYVVAMEMNLAAITYHPRLVEFDLGTVPPKSGPAMYWYGWMTTAAGGGLIAGALAAILTRAGGSAKLWLWLGWIGPAVAMLASAYFMLPFFTA